LYEVYSHFEILFLVTLWKQYAQYFIRAYSLRRWSSFFILQFVLTNHPDPDVEVLSLDMSQKLEITFVEFWGNFNCSKNTRNGNLL